MVDISPPASGQLPRVAQLTQRTNQFNASTIRRTEGEVQRLLANGTLECRVVEVRDRFGDYGLVGLVFFAARAEALVIDTLLLSCRALGRGVELPEALVRGACAWALGRYGTDGAIAALGRQLEVECEDAVRIEIAAAIAAAII